MLGCLSAVAMASAGGVSQRYGNLPLRFERKLGQAAPGARFVIRTQGAELSLDSGGFTLATATGTAAAPLRTRFVGGRTNVALTGEDQQGDSHYFSGDPTRRHTNIETYGRVRYGGVYAGVDIVCHGSQGHFEYDFVVAPGVDPGIIRLAFDGTASIRLDPAGDLVLEAGQGEVRHRKPLLYQELAGARRPIAGRYVLDSSNQIGFEVGSYDPAATLIIDPVLSYSTYLGWSEFTEGNGIAVDATGCAYIVGDTWLSDKPAGGNSAVFVTKLNAAGTGVLFTSFLSGSSRDVGNAVTLDANGNVYITGFTLSPDFPTTSGAFQRQPGGQEDAFIAKLSGSNGTLLYSTYLGGSGTDIATSVVVDAAGAVYVAGYTSSQNFPVSATAAQKTFAGGYYDAFVSKLNLSTSTLTYSTYLGGSGSDVAYGIALDSNDDAYITGYTDSTDFPLVASIQQYAGTGDAFVAEVNATGSSLIFSSYFGGIGADYGTAIAVSSSGIYVAGTTYSTDLPTTTGAFQTSLAGGWDAFVLKIANGAVSYCTYLGGSASDAATGIVVDTSGNVYVAGYTYSFDFPTVNSFQTEAGKQDAFAATLNSAGSALLFSSYLGGSGDDAATGLAVDLNGNTYVTGRTASDDFLAASGATRRSSTSTNTDAFAVKITAVAAPAAPSAISVTPSSGSGLSQTFGFRFSDPGGYATIASAAIRFLGTDGLDCTFDYSQSGNNLEMYNDSDTVWQGPVTLGGSGTLQNSRCVVNAGGVSATGSGTTLTFNLPIAFQTVFAGTRTISVQLVGTNGLVSSWQQMGSWTIPQTSVAPSAISMTPSSGSGLSQTFSFQFSHPGGYAMVAAASIRFLGTDGRDCTFYYSQGGNSLYMFNDSDTVWQGPVTLGGSGALQNSRCVVSAAAVAAAGSGATLTFTLPIAFQSVFAGTRTVWVQLTGGNGLASSWQQMGSWTVSQSSTPVAPSAVSVTPSSGNGLSQTFSFLFSHPLGYAMVAAASIRFAGTDGQDCTFYYSQGGNSLYMFNDSDTVWQGPVTLGGSGTLQNSRCVVSAAGVAAAGSGATLTFTLPIAFQSVFAGTRTVWVQLTGGNGLASSWQQMGSWVVP